MYSRKLYLAVAAIVRAENGNWDTDGTSGTDYHESNGALTALDRITVELATLFANDNPNFDRARFLAACGVEN